MEREIDSLETINNDGNMVVKVVGMVEEVEETKIVSGGVDMV